MSLISQMYAVGRKLLTSSGNSLVQNYMANTVIGNSWSLNPCRSIVRNNWQRPRETIRMKRISYKVRMQTKNGRAIIMRKILKNCHCLGH